MATGWVRAPAGRRDDHVRSSVDIFEEPGDGTGELLAACIRSAVLEA